MTLLFAGWMGNVAAAESPTLDKIRRTGVITLAHRENSIPFSYFDADKRPIGYAIDLCLRAVEALRRELRLPGLKVQYLPVAAADRIPAIVEGRADLECGNTTNNRARREQVAFSVTYYFAGGRLLVPTGSALRDIGDLRGASTPVAIAANKGSTHAKNLEAAAGRGIYRVRVVEVAGAAEALQALDKGAAAAYLHDDIVLAALRAASPRPQAYELVGNLTSVEPLAIMMRKDDPEFKRLVDTALSQVMIDGDIKAIWRRWFEAPIPPSDITLGVPMNTLMRDQIRWPSDKVGD